jgi:ferredoxin
VPYEVEVDQGACLSSGRCVASMGEVFAFDEDELATVRPGAALDDASALVRVARQCPSGAIVLRLGGAPADLERP